MVGGKNKGGLEVTIGSLRGFLPAGQVDLHYVDDLQSYVGQKLRVIVTEANQKKRNLIVSRRAILQQEREESAKALWAKLEIGQKLEGAVRTLKDYGAFVDIGGADGFLHIGEISWTRINKPSDVLQIGQKIEVQVLTLDPEAKKIGLGMKQLLANPWTTSSNAIRQDARSTGWSPAQPNSEPSLNWSRDWKG
jgi:small subunit ribosomal protein S1